MLTVAQPYFESDDFRGDVVLYAAFSHPLLKRLIRFERGLDRLMCTGVPMLSPGILSLVSINAIMLMCLLAPVKSVAAREYKRSDG